MPNEVSDEDKEKELDSVLASVKKQCTLSDHSLKIMIDYTKEMQEQDGMCKPADKWDKSKMAKGGGCEVM